MTNNSRKALKFYQSPKKGFKRLRTPVLIEICLETRNFADLIESLVLVAIGDGDSVAGGGDVSDDSGSPRNPDFRFPVHFFDGRAGANVEQV